ncbi:MAG: YHS domain-containing protein [Sedimentisphaerales bacterium]|nr:YHS domain-containing protein [Sedimentisphaerales bacterium]
MELKRKKSVSVLVFAGLFVAASVLLIGCEKSEPGSTEPSTTEMSQEMAEHEHDAMMATDETMAQVASATEQTICPVMGNPIDKNIFIEYEGKKVYFCCSGCEKLFKENPEKYISKLPQFQK